MINSPCLNCPNRTAPKDCEKHCEKWAKYIKEREIEKQKILNQKKLDKRINECIWKQYNK